jgi:MFS family permease
MLGKKRERNEDTFAEAPTESNRQVGERRLVATARGGVSLGGVLTGVVVTFGALFLLTALVGGIFATSDVNPTELGSRREIGVGIGIGLVAAWFLSSMWGGYTAGRMGRGAGVVNGVLVPIVVLIIGALVAAIVAALGSSANLNLPFRPAQLPTQDSALYDLSAGFGIAILAAMVVGGALGGGLGSRWHTKLERRAIEEEKERSAGTSTTGDGRTETMEMRREDTPRPA